MKSNAEKQLENVRKDLKAFWELINNDENLSIYITAANHNVKLSDAYVEKVTPIAARLKKFIGVK